MTNRTTAGAQQPGLFPTDAETPDFPVARPFLLATRGRTEYGVRCPGCSDMHRHVHLGLAQGPCGAKYYVEPKRGRVRRAA